MDALGTMLRTARRNCGLSQQQLSKRSGVVYNTIGDLERGGRRGTQEDLNAIAKAMPGQFDLAQAQVQLALRHAARRQPVLRDVAARYNAPRLNTRGAPFYTLDQLPPDPSVQRFIVENPQPSPILAKTLIVEHSTDICDGMQCLAKVKDDPPVWHICCYCHELMKHMQVYIIIGASRA